jgi:hypothetical protein
MRESEVTRRKNEIDREEQKERIRESEMLIRKNDVDREGKRMRETERMKEK